jgi:hypothetical protein
MPTSNSLTALARSASYDNERLRVPQNGGSEAFCPPFSGRFSIPLTPFGNTVLDRLTSGGECGLVPTIETD